MCQESCEHETRARELEARVQELHVELRDRDRQIRDLQGTWLRLAAAIGRVLSLVPEKRPPKAVVRVVLGLYELFEIGYWYMRSVGGDPQQRHLWSVAEWEKAIRRDDGAWVRVMASARHFGLLDETGFPKN